MKITRFSLKDFQQFKTLDLDFTYPEGHEKAGQPLEKVCFIGPNGTGKTTLLEFINRYVSETPQVKKNNKVVYYVPPGWHLNLNFNFLDKDVHLKEGCIDFRNKNELDVYITGLNNFIKIYSPAESKVNSYKEVTDVPVASLNNALEYFKDFPNLHIISPETISDFWKLLIYQIKKRDDDYKQFQEQEGNQDKTIRKIKEKFNSENPEILKDLAELWNRLLEPAGLYFDYEHAKNPIQLSDNLLAYIKLKNTGDTIPYQKLSTGIRNFIFKIGHIFSIYFNRKVEAGILLIDEPENSLFPDFLYDLVSIYEEITENTQIFMATHNPIIAAQFDPAERFILDFDEEGYVVARRGGVPAGDDPNDILVKDFGVRSLLGKEGIKKWERYIELKTLIRLETDPVNKKNLMTEYMKIGNDYNFLPERPA